MKSQTAAGIASIAVVLFLGGCASAAPAEPMSPSRTTTQVPTPTPTAASTPTQNPADPSTWILGWDRVADVHLGQSLAALASAAKLVPVDDTVDCPPGYWTAQGAPSGDVRVSLMQEGSRGTAVSDPTFSYAQFAVREPSETVVATSPSTDAGIRLGSTEAELLAAYPSIQKTSSKYDDSMGYTTYADGPSDGRYLVFQVAATPSGARTVINMLSTSRDVAIDVCD